MAGAWDKRIRTPRQLLSALDLTLVHLVATGCVNQVRPPREVDDPVTVYVADHGKHSSLLLPDGGVLQEDDGYIQYAYGDWKTFAMNDNRLGSYARAALFSRRSALGREVHATTDPALLQQGISARRLEAVQVDRRKVQLLRDELEAFWHSTSAESVDNRHVRMTLVPYRGPNARYALWNHCNHMTARWLRRLDCRVWRGSMLSNFQVTRR